MDTMKTILSVLFGFVLLGFSTYPSDLYVDERTSTEVFFNLTDKMFPKNWYSKKINATAEPLDKSERQRMINILDRAFDKYPDNVLKNNLDRVYALKSLKFYDIPYGGTNAISTVYLSDNASNPNFTDSFIEGVFHHEFSSILLRAFPSYLNGQAWKNVNPKSFNYGNGGVNAILSGEASLNFDPSLFEKGFLSKYSESALEEDINVFAQNLFTGGIHFWTIVDQNPRIRIKATILISFYHLIDSTFTENYFRYPGQRYTSR